jgi:hypothetical protein
VSLPCPHLPHHVMMTVVQNAHNGTHLSAGQYCITNIAWDQAIAPLTPRTALACTPIFIKRKMSKGCQNRGCKKLARHPSIFCAFHTVLEVPVVPLERKKSPASSSSINSLLPCRKQKTFAYCQKYSLSHCDHQRCLEAIQSVVSDLLSSVNCRDTVGVRRLVPLPSPVLENIMPFLLAIVELATKVVAFPLKDPVVNAPTLVIAPPSSSRSNAWTKGTLHRDFDCIETTGVYSFLLFLDEVTPENGTVAFWRHSKYIGPIDPRHPERALDNAGLSSELLVGEEGTVYAWDARLLHRSLANLTQKTRVALQWLVTSAGRHGISLSVTT